MGRPAGTMTGPIRPAEPRLRKLGLSYSNLLSNRKKFMTTWLLPQNPGPFGTLTEWMDWRAELRLLGSRAPGVAAELELAKDVIRTLEVECKSLEMA